MNVDSFLLIESTTASSHISSGQLEKSSFVQDLFKKHDNEDNEDSTRQSLARPIFDFIIAAKKQFVNFFSNRKII